ncbi:hypothetical protein [Stakelama marina]|uniref:Uncharacterized protein n=1 Tax=Stakelama marina TaxID=2826939 RepID=A0A8T4IA06_9SPHN|nr:hypothetical protein [Stakelama marina]MBR0551183.1 hypothetical protein [Stakelama marina]
MRFASRLPESGRRCQSAWAAGKFDDPERQLRNAKRHKLPFQVIDTSVSKRPINGHEVSIADFPIADIPKGVTITGMTPVAADLRLSAQRALLGAIYPEVRMVKVRRDGNRIILTAICEKPFSDNALDALSTAAAEIAADFPECDLDECIVGSNEPLPREDVLGEGWLFERAEHQVP